MNDVLTVGARAPDFCLPDGSGKEWSLHDFAGQYLHIFFYPKDLTPGCTIEAQKFQGVLPELQRLEASVVGVSKDSVKRHEKFSSVCGLTYPLLSDPEGEMIEAYGVWQEKKTFGKTYMGIVRMSYLIDPAGCIAKVYPKVSTKSHADEVLADIRSLKS